MVKEQRISVERETKECWKVLKVNIGERVMFYMFNFFFTFSWNTFHVKMSHFKLYILNTKVAYNISYIKADMLHFTSNISHAKFYMSDLTCHILHIKFHRLRSTQDAFLTVFSRPCANSSIGHASKVKFSTFVLFANKRVSPTFRG